ncbi:NAD-dependent epimerase/dehydratase family protein [Hungatella hathewayi]|uniref:NAD-dependent epimerase/dehydratase family protein n=1 Tax=Hungatella hathewayi TaxID=154046 RepID=UPI00356744A4
MKILVTGASGYIGRFLVKELLERGHDVTAADLNHADIDSRANKLCLDIFNEKGNIYTLAGEPEICIHLAWQDGFVHNSPSHMLYLSKHFGFLKDMIDAGCRKIAVMGSMHEVGFWEGKIDENTPCNPLSQYGVAKNALRQSLQLIAEKENIQLYWLRAYYILGDDLHNNSVFTKLLQTVSEGKKEFPFTTGTNKYDFITVQELAKQIAAAVTQDKIQGIINVCSGTPVSLKDMVETFIAERNLDIRLIYGAFPERPYDSKIVYGDNSKIKEILKNRT